ncbi:MAG: universal stress protein [Duganella sp.]
MYRKILITTDGSSVSSKTACAGVTLAEQLGAEVLVLFVASAYQYPIYVEIIPPSYPSEEQYRAAMRQAGDDHTRDVVQACARRNITCTALTTFAESIAQEIVAVGASHGCDLIFIGSHGRSGWGQLLLGSVTNKVLSHSRIPVLVHRLITEPEVKN